VLDGVPLEKLIAADFNRRQGWKYRTHDVSPQRPAPAAPGRSANP
jgi:hypothetical protein